MDYYGIEIFLKDPVLREALVALLAESGCESFEEGEDSLTAYINASDYPGKNIEESVRNFLDANQCEAQVRTAFYPARNWNEEWEKNFDPVIVSDDCVICAPFHTDVPACRYRVVIMPRMSFGTGHHETTFLMCRWILDQDLSGKKVLDMGCGTAVLAVLAAMRGAVTTAVDNDAQACENAQENTSRNGFPVIPVLTGGAEVLSGMEPFDVILANINRNVLTRDMPAYADRLAKGGLLVVSGFFIQEQDILVASAAENGMEFITSSSKNNWACLSFCKK